jgi:hypothetical protein
MFDAAGLRIETIDADARADVNAAPLIFGDARRVFVRSK